MAGTKIVANSRIIYNDIRSELTSGQIANWRFQTFNSQLNSEKYTLDDLKTMMDLDDDGMYNNYIPENINNIIFDKLSRGEIEQGDIWFVMIDSCVMCTQNLEQIIKDIREKLTNSAYIVLIKNNINNIENKFKLDNKNDSRYSNIDFYILKQNIAFIDGLYMDGDSYMDDGSLHDIVITTNIYHENQLLTYAENSILDDTNGYWIPTFRNEANDDAQLLLMKDYMSYICDSNGLIITHDKLLIEKIKNEQINNEFLNYYNP
jgi:hypothetical protein